MKFYVYAHLTLAERAKGTVFYIGKGCRKRAWRKDGHSEYWNRVVEKYGYRVHIVSSGLTEKQAFDLEKSLIALCGHEILCNMSSGGDGGMSGVKMSDEVKAKIGSKAKIRGISENTRIAQKIALTGRKLSEPHIEKVKLSNKGLRRSEETRKRMSEAAKNRGISPATRAANIAALTGKKQLPEVIKKRADANRGGKRSEETRKRMSEAQKKPVVCSNGMIFDSFIEAIKWLKEIGKTSASGGNLSSACMGKQKSAYGFTWKYA